MTSNPLVGTWKLVAFHIRTADGRVSYPFGPHVAGYLIYTGQQHMSVVFGRADRPRVAGDDAWAGTDEEKAAAYDSCMAYAGTYGILGERVIHHVEVSLAPNWVGTDLVRSYVLEDDRLTLNTPPYAVRGIERTAQLVWERVQ